MSILLVLLVAGARSARAGINVWTSLGPDGGRAGLLKIEPGTGAVFAGSVSGICRSADGGGSWERRNRGASSYILDLAFAAAPLRTIYAAGTTNAYRSTDAGLTWTALLDSQLGPLGAYSVAADPGDAATVYLGTSYQGVLKSTDGGATWAHTGQFACGSVWSLALDPRDARTIYAGCTRDSASPVFKSTDGGATWNPIGSGLPSGPASSLAVRIVLAPDRPDTLFVSLAGNSDKTDIFRSRDGGDHWEQVGPGGFPLATGPSGVVYAGTHRSTDGGETWSEIGALPAPAGSYLVDPAAPQTVYASAGWLGVFKSVDGGTTWAAANRGFRATDIEALAIDPQQTSTLYVYARGLGLRKSLNGGGRWRRADAGLPADLDIFAPPVLAIDPVTPARLWIGWQHGLARSTDGGASWTVLDPPAGQCLVIKDLAVDPRSPATLMGAGFLATGCDENQGCSVFRSTDAGATWHCAGPPTTYVNRVVIDPVEPARVYAVSLFNQGVWKSEDRGAHWRLIGRGLRYADAPLTLAVDPVDPRRLYLGTLSKLMKSTDRGETWVESGRGLPADVIHTLVVNPKTPRIVYAGGNFGVYITGNGGLAWYSMSGGLPSFAWQLALDPKDPDRLFAGTASSLYTYERRK